MACGPAGAGRHSSTEAHSNTRRNLGHAPGGKAGRHSARGAPCVMAPSVTAPSRTAPGGRLLGDGRRISHLKDLQLLDAVRRLEGDQVALARLGQRARHRRHPADLAVQWIELVDADDGDAALFAVLVAVGDGGAEEDLVRAVVHAGVDDGGQVHPLGQEADAPVDLAQPPLAVDIVAVLGAVAVRRGPVHDAHHFRPRHVDQFEQLVLDALVAGRRDVILRAGRNRQRRRFLVVVAVRLFYECFVHAPIVAAARPAGAPVCGASGVFSRIIHASEPARPCVAVHDDTMAHAPAPAAGAPGLPGRPVPAAGRLAVGLRRAPDGGAGALAGLAAARTPHSHAAARRGAGAVPAAGAAAVAGQAGGAVRDGLRPRAGRAGRHRAGQAEQRGHRRAHLRADPAGAADDGLVRAAGNVVFGAQGTRHRQAAGDADMAPTAPSDGGAATRLAPLARTWADPLARSLPAARPRGAAPAPRAAPPRRAVAGAARLKNHALPAAYSFISVGNIKIL